MSEINKTAAATAIAVSLATLIAMTGSAAAKTPAPQRGYCLLYGHGGADCSFTSKPQQLPSTKECYQDDGEVYLRRSRARLGKPGFSSVSPMTSIWMVMGIHPLAGILKYVLRGITNSGQRQAADEMEHWA